MKKKILLVIPVLAALILNSCQTYISSNSSIEFIGEIESKKVGWKLHETILTDSLGNGIYLFDNGKNNIVVIKYEDKWDRYTPGSSRRFKDHQDAKEKLSPYFTNEELLKLGVITIRGTF